MRPRRVLRNGFSVVLLMTASAGHAQLDPETPIGSRIRQKPEQIIGVQQARLFREMSECVYRRDSNRVDFFLRNSDDFKISPEVGQVASYLSLEACLGWGIAPDANAVGGKFSGRSLRNWLAETAYLANNPVPPQRTAESSPAVARSYFASAGELPNARGLGEFSDCLVGTDMAGADRLVRSARVTPEERAAAQALGPALSTCLPAGQALSLKLADVRGLAAQGLWQRYEAVKPAQYKGRP